jgi:hypothetical protein
MRKVERMASAMSAASILGAIRDIVTTGVSSVIYSHGDVYLAEGRKCFFKCPSDTVILQYPVKKYCLSSIDSKMEYFATNKGKLVANPSTLTEDEILALHELLLYGPGDLVPILTLTMENSTPALPMEILTYDNPAAGAGKQKFCQGVTAELKKDPLSDYAFNYDVVEAIRTESRVAGQHHAKHVILITACTICNIDNLPPEGPITRAATAPGYDILQSLARHESAKVHQLHAVGLTQYGVVATMPSLYSTKANTKHVAASAASGGAGAAAPASSGGGGGGAAAFAVPSAAVVAGAAAFAVPSAAVVAGAAPSAAGAAPPAPKGWLHSILKACGLRANSFPLGRNIFPGSTIRTYDKDGMGGGARKNYRTCRNKHKARKSSRRTRRSKPRRHCTRRGTRHRWTRSSNGVPLHASSSAQSDHQRNVRSTTAG